MNRCIRNHRESSCMNVHSKTVYTWIKKRGDKTRWMPHVGLFSQKPLIIGLFCAKWLWKMRHPVGVGHPVDIYTIAAGLNLRMCTQTLTASPTHTHRCVYVYVYNTTNTLCIYAYANKHMFLHIYIYIIYMYIHICV